MISQLVKGLLKIFSKESVEKTAIDTSYILRNIIKATASEGRIKLI